MVGVLVGVEGWAREELPCSADEQVRTGNRRLPGRGIGSRWGRSRS